MKNLIDILDKETNIYSKYLELSEKKKNAIEINDLDELDLIIEEEKNLSSKIFALEAARLEYLQENGYQKNLSLTKILEKLPVTEREELSDAALKLRQTLELVNHRELISFRQSSAYLNHMIKVFGSFIN